MKEAYYMIYIKPCPIALCKLSMLLFHGKNLEIMPEDLMYGPYYDLNQGKYKVEVFGKNLKNASWNISSYNKNQNFDYKISEQSNNKISIEFELKEQVNDVEIKAFNEGEQSILVDCMLISMYK